MPSRTATLTARIREVHEDSRKTYGSPRIHAELQEEGQRVGRKRVARLMREARLEGASRRRFVKTTQRAEDARPAPDLIDRDFSVSGPDQLWVADITYVPTWAGFLYLAVVLDAWSRRVVGWAMATHLRTELVLDALVHGALAAAAGGGDPSLRSGHAVHVRSRSALRCKQAGVRPSIGSVGDAYDNRDVRELLRHARVRAAGAVPLPYPGRSATGGVRLHRGLVQSAAAPLRARLPVAGQLRASSRSLSGVAGRIQVSRLRIRTYKRRSRASECSTPPLRGGSFPLPGDRESLNTSSLTRPRNRGRSKHLSYMLQGNAYLGSSPRRRGTHPVLLPPAFQDRIIPA